MKNDMMIKTLIGAVIVAVVIITIINYNKREQMLEDIKAYVEANNVNLKKIAEAKIKNEKITLPKHVTSVELYGPTKEKDYRIIEFEYANENGTVYGFYYSPKDIPAAYHNENYDLLELGNDKWMWNSEDKGEGKTEKIKPSWYYYSAKK